ncbi:hypothetical protein [Tropicibacter naphthalenivorans]|uniref:Uncharacterized protein n=1 Tax=Tropicibacter naphthalenivorans TaxID=441103 RepID=A0A0P1G2I9_9RHOB|nr:hypothetical protein [Tropicibacter naphthalenivorans]CUH75878.1 hypothetical protein TRN7648_00671 [Tropicibacter naphthalenivorans]SMC41643.1 hypothetical protein SAMN04488093_101213 [Tropicibacter naphthalenivorans]
MRLSCLALIALVLPAAALADGPYGNAPGCADGPAQDGAVLFHPGERIEFAETSCPITGVLQVGAGAMVLTLACSGEGETWEAYYMIETTAEGGFAVYPEDRPEDRTELSQCK